MAKISAGDSSVVAPDVTPSEIIKDVGDSLPPDIDTPSSIELQLRADKELDLTMAKMLSEMIKAAYKEAKKSDTGEG